MIDLTNCEYPELVQDGHCNDEANNIECLFDGGDCCYPCVSTKFCSDCKCLTENSDIEIKNPLIEDGFCQDEMNNVQCNYDGGDCCESGLFFDSVKKEHCLECECIGHSKWNISEGKL